jgi:solute carrier family 25 carnitine/acylcarnitine transporter 20/29
MARYKGVFDCAHKIYSELGIRGFFRGFGPTMLRAFPANAATFLAYEVTRKNLLIIVDNK